MPRITKKQARELGIPHKHLHTIIIHKDAMTLDHMLTWLADHGYKTGYRETTNTYRFNQIPEILGARYYSVKIPRGVIMVFQEY